MDGINEKRNVETPLLIEQVWGLGKSITTSSFRDTLAIFERLVKTYGVDRNGANCNKKKIGKTTDRKYLARRKKLDLREIELWKEVSKLMNRTQPVHVLRTIKLLSLLLSCTSSCQQLVGIFINLSICHYVIEEYEFSLQYAFKALALEKSRKAFFRVGAAYSKLGLHVNAEEALIEALKLKPSDSVTKAFILKNKEKAISSEGYDEHLVEVAVHACNSIPMALREVGDIFSFKRKYMNPSHSLPFGKEFEHSKKFTDLPTNLFGFNSFMVVDFKSPIKEEKMKEILLACGDINVMAYRGEHRCLIVQFTTANASVAAFKELVDAKVIQLKDHKFRLVPGDDQQRLRRLGQEERDAKRAIYDKSGECINYRNRGCVVGKNCRFLHLSACQAIDNAAFDYF